MNEETIIESNKQTPLLIVKKPTKKISTQQYYGTSNLENWDLQKIIQDRVNRESEALYA